MSSSHSNILSYALPSAAPRLNTAVQAPQQRHIPMATNDTAHDHGAHIHHHHHMTLSSYLMASDGHGDTNSLLASYSDDDRGGGTGGNTNGNRGRSSASVVIPSHHAIIPSSSSSSSSSSMTLSSSLSSSSSSSSVVSSRVVVSLAMASEPSGMISEDSADPELFPPDLDKDFICKICDRIPKRPSSPHCCGQISCRECLLRWLRLHPSCPYCRAACTTSDVLASPFVATRLSGLNVRCPNHRGTSATTSVSQSLPVISTAAGSSGGLSRLSSTEASTGRPGCGRVLLFGREGIRLMEHVTICDYQLVECPDCHETMLRRDMATHRPADHDVCTRMPLLCDACNIQVARGDLDVHNGSRAHRDNTTRKLALLDQHVKGLESALGVHQTLVHEIKTSISNVHELQAKMIHDCDQKLDDMEKKHEVKLQEVRQSNSAVFVEFHIPRWSDVKEAALFSTATPQRAWQHDWWLKVEKASDRIGVYLCCGEDGIFPISVDYQLMVRKRSTDDAVCSSSLFHTEFGIEKAWGLSKFTTIEQLTKDGAYVAAEDAITFGCLIYPSRGCMWGRTAVARRTVTAASSSAAAAAVAMVAANSSIVPANNTNNNNGHHRHTITASNSSISVR